MNIARLFVGILAFAAAQTALAGPATPLGTPLGQALGVALGAVLGISLGESVPIAHWGLLVVGAMSLVFGILIVRRKLDR
ncbi:MAG TPA: hypothetical protein VF959_02945 [Casimicrobiaceae bacterium]